MSYTYGCGCKSEDDVCFNPEKHPGTDQWREAVLASCVRAVAGAGCTMTRAKRHKLGLPRHSPCVCPGCHARQVLDLVKTMPRSVPARPLEALVEREN